MMTIEDLTVEANLQRAKLSGLGGEYDPFGWTLTE